MELSKVTEFQLKRENPFEGLVIDADTWRDALNYHRDHQRLHILTFHNTGIVGGLEVNANDTPDLSVIIRPGIGIDPEGNTIIVPKAQKYKIQTSKKSIVYLVILFREIPGEPYQPAEGGQPTRIIEGYRLEERESLPAEPYLELARIDFDPATKVIKDPKSPAKPGKNEIDFRYRQGAAAPPSLQAASPPPPPQPAAEQTPPSAPEKPEPNPGPSVQARETIAVGHAVLGEADKDLHVEGLRNLAREVNSHYQIELELSENISLARGLTKLNVLYLAGMGEFDLSDAEQAALGKFLESGGIIIGEGCSEVEGKGAKEFGLAFNKLATQLKCKLENVQRGHELLSSANIFSSVPEGAAAGMLLAGGRMIYSGSDYGCAWQGGYSEEPLSREVIRSSVEIGFNMISYR
ncbi:MAG: DUF4159 domain-containing protein [Dehalococcoidia bacterium]